MHTFETPAPITANVDIVLGYIRFNASDRADTVVEVDPVDPSRPLDVEAAELVEVEFSDGTLRVAHPKLRTMFTKKFGSVKVRVELPTGSNLHGETAQGEQVVKGAVGACRLKIAIGDIRLDRAAAARLRTSGGRVSADHVTGRADVHAGGEVRLGRVDADVKVKSNMGSVSVGEIGSGPVDLYSAVGGLEVGVPAGTAVLLDANASVGRVRDDLDAPERPERTVKVRARCHGGDIVIRRAERLPGRR
ncbi:hypothetical protein [Glycomyces salinus]|uniref:hypothetical protein n=1 Tax=Glycomyces salinus TaxID=980294 RepID=UPI0018EB9921|nr:hypothetical protein [Glycomyces salinus]